MLDFNRDSIFNLKAIEYEKINPNIIAILLDGEEVISAYRTVRDQFIFTNRRMITMDVKWITGKKKEIFTLPYSRIQYFSVQTVGFLEIFPDAELNLFFANGCVCTFEFKGTEDILKISKVLGEFVTK